MPVLLVAEWRAGKFIGQSTQWFYLLVLIQVIQQSCSSKTLVLPYGLCSWAVLAGFVLADALQRKTVATVTIPLRFIPGFPSPVALSLILQLQCCNPRLLSPSIPALQIWDHFSHSTKETEQGLHPPPSPQSQSFSFTAFCKIRHHDTFP